MNALIRFTNVVQIISTDVKPHCYKIKKNKKTNFVLTRTIYNVEWKKSVFVFLLSVQDIKKFVLKPGIKIKNKLLSDFSRSTRI